jgi:hypothetical protein
MKLSNKHNIPMPIYQHVKERMYPPKEGRMGVTTLINPPLVRTLFTRHYNEIEHDVSDYLWMVLSSGVHHILSKYDDKLLLEHKMEQKIGDITLVGKSDIIDGDAIDDYKVTSIWSYLAGIKDEWTQQLNCYAYMRTIEGMWMKSKSYQRDYPPIPFQSKDVPVWSFEKQEQFIKMRLQDHLENPERKCTSYALVGKNNEMWEKPTVYAVKKKGQKNAVRGGLHDSNNDAVKWMVSKKYTEQGGYYIEIRKGDRVRCSNYCGVSGVCPHVKSVD